MAASGSGRFRVNKKRPTVEPYRGLTATNGSKSRSTAHPPDPPGPTCVRKPRPQVKALGAGAAFCVARISIRRRTCRRRTCRRRTGS